MTTTLNTTASIYLIDSDYVNRETLASLLESLGYSVTSFRNGQDFLECDSFEDPNPQGRCLLVDVNLDGMTSFEVQENVSGLCNCPPLIFLASQGTISQAVRAMQFGALNFLQRPISQEVLLQQIETALEFDLVQQRQTGRIGQIESRLNRLSGREQEILREIASGKTSKEISLMYGISQRTVENHRFRMMQKMSARSTIELVRMVFVVEACRQFQPDRNNRRF